MVYSHEFEQLPEVARATARERAETSGAQQAPPTAAVLSLQRLAGNESVNALLEEDQPSPVRDVVGSGGGSPLEPGVRGFMEQRLGHDFTDVRVHTGGKADESARSISAQAYTVGSDVVFRGGAYQPGTPTGQRVIAHELAHVVQQKAGPVAGTPAPGGIRLSNPSDPFEQAAEETARGVTTQSPPMPASAPVAASVQRAGEEEEKEEETTQALTAQRAGEEEEDETAQALFLQRTGEQENVNALHAMPGQSGQAAGSRISVQRQGLTFEPMTITGNVTNLGPSVAGVTPDGYVQDRVNRLGTSIRSMQAAWIGGVDAFMAHGIFASSDEAQPKYGEAVLKYAFKAILKEVVAHIGEEVPGIGKVYELTVGLFEELDKEHERIEKAEAQLEMKNFINEYRASVTDSFNKKAEKAGKSKPDILQGYKDAIGTASPDTQASTLAKPTTTTDDSIAVAGPAAEFLNTLERSTAAIEKAVPKMEACLAALSVAWVEKVAGNVASKGGGDVYTNGRIYLSLDVHVDEGGTATITPPGTAKLAAPQAGKVADALMEAMKGTGGSINDLIIEKKLTINIEMESGHWYSTNDRYRAGVVYADPDSPTHYIDAIPVEGTEIDPIKMRKASQLAFGPAFNRALVAVTKLEPY